MHFSISFIRLLTLVLAGAAAAVDASGAAVVVADDLIFTSGFVATLGESLEALVATKDVVEEAFERKTRHVMNSFNDCTWVFWFNFTFLSVDAQTTRS